MYCHEQRAGVMKNQYYHRAHHLLAHITSYQQSHLLNDAVAIMAQELHDDTKGEFTAEAQWNGAIRRRDFENRLVQISSTAAKAASFLGNDEAGRISNILFKLSITLEERRALFQLLRETPSDVMCRTLTENEVNIIVSNPNALNGHIFTTVAQAFSNSTDLNAVVMCLSLARFVPKNPFLNISLLEKPAGSQGVEWAPTAVSTLCQTNIVMTFIEKGVKKVSSREFVELLTLLTNANLGFEISEFPWDTADNSIPSFQPSGWTMQNFMDIRVLTLMGQFLQMKSDNVHRNGSARVPRKLRLEAEACFRNIGKLSDRVRTYVRVGGVGTQNNANLGWGVITEQVSTNGNEFSEEQMSTILSMLAPFY